MAPDSRNVKDERRTPRSLVEGPATKRSVVDDAHARPDPITPSSLLGALPRLGSCEADALARDIDRGLARMRTDAVEWD